MCSRLPWQITPRTAAATPTTIVKAVVEYIGEGAQAIRKRRGYRWSVSAFSNVLPS